MNLISRILLPCVSCSLLTGLVFANEKESPVRYVELLRDYCGGSSHLESVEGERVIDALASSMEAIFPPDRRSIVERGEGSMHGANRAVAALIEYEKSQYEFGDLELKTVGETYKLCEDERFYDLPTLARCTGFLVRSNRMVTAGHCIDAKAGDSCQDYSFVFDFAISEGQCMPDSWISERKIIGCRTVVSEGGESEGLRGDWKVVELADEVVIDGVVPLQLGQTEVKGGDSLLALGHPFGLPLIASAKAQAKSSSEAGLFDANLDLAGKSSGSPVFLESSMRKKKPVVVGLVATGSIPDLVLNQDLDCHKVKVCEPGECEWVSVIRMSEFASAIDAPAEED